METGMHVGERDKAILRELGHRKAEIAALPVQKERETLWTRLNDLDPVKPMVWLNDICWHEMNVDGELTLRCEDPFCQELERELRQTLYWWEHMPGDMVVEPAIRLPLVIRDTGLGLDVQEDVLSTDPANRIVSHHYKCQFETEADIQKIRLPRVSVDREQTDARYQAACDIFTGVLPVEHRGVDRPAFSPWDQLVRWGGVEEMLVATLDRPAFVHKIMDRMVTAYLHRLDQYEALNVLMLNDTNVRIVSGAYGYTDQLPRPDYDRERVRPLDMWGGSAAQIFAVVSPQMHEEFALQYELRWLSRFGLNYYGCCEPLHARVDNLRKIPRLRKISMSPSADAEVGADALGRDFVFSHKPNPAILAEDVWRPDVVRAELARMLEITRGCAVEIIMKDISTVRYQPQRLWEWTAIASELTERVAAA